jgi:hypothetical protein
MIGAFVQPWNNDDKPGLYVGQNKRYLNFAVTVTRQSYLPCLHHIPNIRRQKMIECPFSFGFYQEDHDILICHPKGELTADKMNDIAICRECIVNAGITQVDRFHNLTDITSVNLGFDHVRQICHEESILRKDARPIKACYLVPNPLLYGTIRMYQTLIEDYGVEVHVSYDINDFAGILGVDISVLTSKHLF